MASLATTVGHYVDRGYPEGDVGIEFEMESQGNNGDAVGSNYWKLHPDGSLKLGEGLEFSTYRPIKIGEVKDCLKDFKDVMKRLELRPYEDSRRTSVHVHVNVSEFTLLEIYNLIASYWAVEHLLIAYSGSHRSGNNFCLQTSEAEEQKMAIIRDLRKKRHFTSIFGHDWRYSALNLDALQKFGSVEFRSMRGIYDIKFVQEWIEELYNFVQSTKVLFKTPDDVLKALELGEEGFPARVFDWSFSRKLKEAHGPGWEGKIIDNTMWIIDLAQAGGDWSVTEKEIQEAKEQRKKKAGGDIGEIKWVNLDLGNNRWIARDDIFQRPIRAAPRPDNERLRKNRQARAFLAEFPNFDPNKVELASRYYVGWGEDFNGQKIWVIEPEARL